MVLLHYLNLIILKFFQDNSLVLFLNDKLLGDYAVVNVCNKDIEFCDDLSLPKELFLELSQKLKEKINYEKNSFNHVNAKEYDLVELLVEDEKYTKYGIHKGDQGVTAIGYAVKNQMLVDFTGVRPNGEFYGELISVNLKDIKILDTKKTD